MSSEQRYADAADPAARIRRDPAARARPRVPRRPLRRPLDHPHQLAGAELPPHGGAGRRVGRPLDVARPRRARATTPSSTTSACSADFLAIEERSGGLRKVRVRSWDGGRDFDIASDEPAYRAELGDNEELGQRTSSATPTPRSPRPTTTYDYDVRTGRAHAAQAGAGARRLRRRALRHGVPVGAGARRRARSRSRSCTARASAGTAAAPLLQYGYGVLRPVHATRSSARRGSRCSTAASSTRSRRCAAGRNSAAAGTTTAGCSQKQNTFNDFIDVTRFLVQEGYADPERVFARGGSAGGLLMGAVVNLAPAGLQGDRRARAVRGRGHDDARRQPPAHDQRIRRVGQPEREGASTTTCSRTPPTTTSRGRPTRRCW